MADKDKSYMRMALKLARRGEGRSSCEPLVGAVVVRGDRVTGRGFAGGDRARPAVISALDVSGREAPGSAIYTNILDVAGEDLERLIESRPARVVVGASLHSGSAIDRLRQAGIEVVTGVLEHESLELNEKYFKYAATGSPFVTAKFAQTLDGRLATATGNSQWISGPASLRLAHRLRVEHDAIMVGIGTVLADDPRLTVRLVNGRDPIRVVVDSRLRIPTTARVLANGASRHTLIATARGADGSRARALEALGAQILAVPEEPGGGGLNVTELLAALGSRRIASVLVEGGAGIITSLLAARQIDRLVVAVAPKIIGRGIEAIGDLNISHLSGAITFKSMKTRKLGPDVIFDGRIKYSGQ